MQSSIYFGSYKSYDVNNYANYKSTNLCLLKRYLSLLENAPKNFTITTKNGSCKFNLELLKETSKVISDFIEDNHNLQFDFDIQDNENVLSKFESLYQGKKVVFDINDFPTFLKIKEKLNITCFYDSNNYIIHMNNHNNESKDNLNLISILNEGIQIHGVLDYLQINELPTFIIATKQNKYACNIFGVCSSKVIRNFIEKNPQEKKFVLEIDDEFDEFQPISELFNFDKIDLNKDNFELIKEFVEDLQIKCLLDDINEFIKNNNKISQKLDEQQKFVDLYDELFDMLHNIKEKTVEFVKNSILKSIWIETEENIQELAAFIIQAIKSDILLHPYIVDLLIQLNEEANESNYLKILLPFIVEKLIFYGIKHYSCSYNRYYEINENSLYPSFIYKLYKKGLMPKEKIISSLKNYSIQDKTVKGWFLPILNELKLLEETKKDEFFNKYLPDKIDIYVKMLDSEPDDMLTKSLRNDDVDTLQSIISRTNIDINKSYVPYNIFDNFMQNEKMSYLNYAAYFGSLKCFKYLLLNHANINKETFQCAIFGGNIEIIKIVDNNNLYHYDERDIEKQISNCIITYRNDLFDWLLEQKTNGNQQYLYSSIAFHSAKNGNIYSLIGIMDKGFDINNDSKQLLQYSSMNGFYRYFKFVLSILDKDQKSKYCNQNTYENICFYYVSFGNASIFKLYLEEFHDRNLESAIYCAIERNYMNIINTFFEYLLKYKKSNVSPNKILNAALRKETDELFIYLLSKLKTIYSKLVFNNELFMELLKDTCRLNNLTICNTITDIILSNKPKEDFSPAFKTAASNGSNEICQYFIDKKVFINFNKIIPKHKKEFIDIEKYGLLNVNVFSFLINNTDPELQENYSNCIYYSIKNKNKDLTEYLCNRFGVQSDFNFPFVVSQSDLDLVNIILKYNSRLEFINQVRNNRTALSTAVYYSCTPIVKRLLSIPGINASLSFNEYETPLSIAVKNKNLEIIDILIDFYGDSMKNKTHELDEIMKIITGSYSANNYDQKVIDRILKIEYIDPNYVFYEVQITINDERDSDNDSNTDYDTGDKYDDYNNDDDYDFDDFDYNIQSCSNDDTNEYNCNLLICACKNNDVDMVKMLLKLEKINVNQYSLKKGFTPLIAAIKNKSLEAAELLILYPKTDINQQDYDRNTALCYAVQNDLENIVDLLIKNEKFDHEKNRINHIFTFSHFPIATKLASIKMLDVNNIVYIYENTKHKRKIFYSTKLIESAKSNDIKMIDLIVHHPSFDKNKLPSKIWTYQIF